MDERDKTVFKQPTPGGGGDRTVMRPSPGRAGPGRGANRPNPRGDTAGYGQASSARPQRAPNLEPVDFSSGQGLNPLVNLASTLLTVFSKTRGSTRHPNVPGLHNSLVKELREFEMRCRDNAIDPDTVWASRYLLCCALDEAVLHTPWGGESAWGQRTLLSIFHNETSGGEKCFQILDKMRAAPADNLYFLELFYIVLSLGYEGKYRLINRGRDALDALRDDLFRSIRGFRGEYERALSPAWMGLGKTRKSLSHYVPMWVVGSVAAAVLFLSFGGFSYWMYNESTPVVSALDSVAVSPEEEKKPTFVDP